MDIEEKIVTITRGDIACLTCGSGRTIVFLHGGSVNPWVYLPFLELLAKDYTIIAPTHPGHGDSFPLGKTWKLDDYTTTYRELFASLSLAPGIIIGHSVGGMLALMLASEGIGNHIIAMDPTGLPFALTPRAYVAAKKKEARQLLAYRNDYKRAMTTLSAAGTLLHTALSRPNDIVWLAKHVPQIDLSSLLVTIPVPVTLFWGKDDGIVPVAVGKRMHGLIPHSTLTILPNKGHTYPVTDPEFTYREIVNIINK